MKKDENDQQNQLEHQQVEGHQEEEEEEQENEHQHQEQEQEAEPEPKELEKLDYSITGPPSQTASINMHPSPLSLPPSSIPPKITSPPLDSPPISTISWDKTSQPHVSHPPEVNPPKPPPKVESKTQDGEAVRQVEEVSGAGSGIRLRPNLSILRRAKMENIKRKVLLGFRISGFVFCLVSFSVMAADKNRGWALDSFYHYKEFRYCMSMNVIGFAYSGLQGYDLAYALTSGKRLARTQFRHLLDFALDQILAYLLLSASSSAAFRIEDWEFNWGTDKFPTMAKASVALSFLAFVAFSFCSLISARIMLVISAVVRHLLSRILHQ